MSETAATALVEDDAADPNIHRFLPTGRASLSEDAPGWGSVNDEGPICWKCRGNTKPCPVCRGRGRIASNRSQKNKRRGRITRARTPYSDWKPSGPQPFGLSCRDSRWADLVQLADSGSDVSIQDDSDGLPSWIPKQGEELCRLVGSWRILQCVGCHRWTTDDLLTAWVAAQEIPNVCHENTIKYLDLGTGNASVLQMVVWATLKQKVSIEAVGVEARFEAVNLARRSLKFNLGPDAMRMARVEKGDFRDFPLQANYYDIVTGTPPYFRVQFNQDNGVQAAVIQEGGMPTARQSAPARCEFRGGIEAYCIAAARALVVPTGRLVVCENWKNHDRVLEAARAAELKILKVVQVEGRPGRGTLFAVYVMGHEMASETKTEQSKLTVRNEEGNWTAEYLRTVMNDMSIPALGLSG
jgi:tRNA1Val (adenine37-N6)-methyltransferase